MNADEWQLVVQKHQASRKAFSGFMNNVLDFFKADNPLLVDESCRYVVHSVRSREKEISHLKEKVERKEGGGRIINSSNIFTEITDVCGVRVLHLRLTDFAYINKAIQDHVQGQHWQLAEKPKAYTWDPEYKNFFEGCGVETEIKESFYTSVHYVVKPNSENFVSCEIQVRSLFEEIWGEIDHQLNYPLPTQSISCREQLKVLAKLVGAGTKLVESIYSSNTG